VCVCVYVCYIYYALLQTFFTSLDRQEVQQIVAGGEEGGGGGGDGGDGGGGDGGGIVAADPRAEGFGTRVLFSRAAEQGQCT
jgi:hypothetical protein